MSNFEIPVPPCVLPPRDSYRFWPPSNYIFHGTGKKLVRHVFEYQNLSEFEKEKLSRLESKIKDGKLEKYNIPSTWSRNHLLRYCYGTNWKTRNSVKALTTYLKWNSEKIPAGYKSLYPKVKNLLNSGTFYICGRDSMFRPLIVLDFSKIDFKTSAIELYSDMLCFLLEYVIEYMLIPGQIENWVVLIDLGKKGLGSLSINSLKQVLSILQINFRCRMGMTYIVNPPKSMFMLWSCIKPFLDDILIEKIRIANGSTSPEMLSTFNPHQIEEKYGGRLKNLETFWPPLVNSSSFDPPNSLIQLSNKDSFSQFNKLESESSEEANLSFHQKSISRNPSQELSIVPSNYSQEDKESQKIFLSEEREQDKENSVFFDCKSSQKSFEKSVKFEEKLQSSVKKPLKEKSVNCGSMSPYREVSIHDEFETPKRKGPRPISIIFERDDSWRKCPNFGCCDSENSNCAVF